MLVLSRHHDERIIIGHDTVITVVEIRYDKVRLGIEAPVEIPVHRQEVYEAILRETGEPPLAGKGSRKPRSRAEAEDMVRTGLAYLEGGAA